MVRGIILAACSSPIKHCIEMIFRPRVAFSDVIDEVVRMGTKIFGPVAVPTGYGRRRYITNPMNFEDV